MDHLRLHRRSLLNRAAHMFVVVATVLTAAAQTPNTNRVPPFGIVLSAEDRQPLIEGVEKLGAELAAAKERLSPSAPEREFLPDAEIFHKAVNWALIYQEFYRANEISAARRLVDQGVERARQLAAGKTPWTTATGLVVRAYHSRVDRSIQPYGLVVPPRFATDTNHNYRLDVWLHGRDNNLTELKFLTDRQRSYGEFTPPDTFVLHPYGRYCNAFKFAGETDVMEALAHVRKNYPIDSTRITIRGFSMGGAGFGTWPRIIRACGPPPPQGPALPKLPNSAASFRRLLGPRGTIKSSGISTTQPITRPTFSTAPSSLTAAKSIASGRLRRSWPKRWNARD